MVLRKVSNKDAGYHVNRMEEFDSNTGSLWARWEDIGTGETEKLRKALYVVYSYGPHHPLYVYERSTGKWYRNMGKASRTTSCHLKHAHPGVPCEDIQFTVEMKALARGGVMELIAYREENRRVWAQTRAMRDAIQQIADTFTGKNVRSSP